MTITKEQKMLEKIKKFIDTRTESEKEYEYWKFLSDASKRLDKNKQRRKEEIFERVVEGNNPFWNILSTITIILCQIYLFFIKPLTIGYIDRFEIVILILCLPFTLSLINIIDDFYKRRAYYRRIK